MRSLFLSKLVNRLSCGRVKYGWWSAPWTSDERPILIAGSGRSGSTLLRELLNAHRELSIGPETGVFNVYPEATRLAGLSGLSVDRIRRIYYQSHTRGDFFQRLNRTLMEGAGKTQWGEKTPSHIRHLTMIFRSFPQARLIHSLRDGRDVVCSLRTHPKYRWSDGTRVETGIINPWDECVDAWLRDVKSGLEWRDDPRYLEVRYEALVANPEATLRSLLSWLGLAWDAGMLERYRTDRYLLQPRLSEEIDEAAVGRWRRELLPEGRLSFRGEAGALLIQLGYAADESWMDA